MSMSNTEKHVKDIKRKIHTRDRVEALTLMSSSVA